MIESMAFALEKPELIVTPRSQAGLAFCARDVINPRISAVRITVLFILIIFYKATKSISPVPNNESPIRIE